MPPVPPPVARKASMEIADDLLDELDALLKPDPAPSAAIGAKRSPRGDDLDRLLAEIKTPPSQRPEVDSEQRESRSSAASLPRFPSSLSDDAESK